VRRLDRLRETPGTPTIMKRLILLLVLITLSSTVHAQRFHKKSDHTGWREGRWEVAALMFSQGSNSQSFEDGSAVDVDSKLGWGLSIGWNWTPKWRLSYTLGMVQPDYTANVVPQDPEVPAQVIDYTMTRYINQLNATYHFFRGPLTPFVQAGIGWSKLDSNIPNRPPIVGCWYDPWWGYICDTSWSTYNTSQFTYNLGLGLRWDINQALFMRGTYNREFMSVDRGNLDFDLMSLEIGLMW
jgi:opacity protein-like surface antigen